MAGIAKGRLLIMLSTGALIAGLLAVSFINFYYRSDVVLGKLIANDVLKLAEIFDKIDKSCRIQSFDKQQNTINFLNVKEFQGSEVGPMNLAYPDKWEGPYLPDNPDVQGKNYMVVRTEKGYYITPGNGVKLPNDLVIGKDIILNEKANMRQLVHVTQQLMFNRRPLAQPIAIGSPGVTSAIWRTAH